MIDLIVKSHFFVDVKSQIKLLINEKLNNF